MELSRRRAAVEKTAESPSRFYLTHLALPLAAMGALLAAVEVAGLDWKLTGAFFDPVAQRFPLRSDWFLEVVLHHWMRYAIVTVALLALAGFLLSFWLPQLGSLRRDLLFVFLAMALSTGTVSALKHVTNKHCPWDLDIYGGYAPYSGLFDQPPVGVQAGRCFPGGHASAGFSLMAFYFVLRRRQRGLAYAALAAGLGMGFGLGLGRVVQGAHFLSHNLWAALLCWTVMLAVYEAMLRRHRLL